MKNNYILIFILLFPFYLSAQSITGKVSGVTAEGDTLPLAGANLFWLGDGIGTVTDLNGGFTLGQPKADDRRLRVSYVGYKTAIFIVRDELELSINLLANDVLDGVVIEGDQSSVNFLSTGPVNMEQINGKELLKAPCCNLSESFETSVTVDAEFSDAVTGARTIRMLGLDGVYALITSEGVPAVRGLSSGYGLNFIPGSWIESIQVTKGIGSVVYGYEGMTGSINAEMKKPNGEDAEALFVNLFGSNNGRLEANINSALKLGDGLYTGILAHTAQNHTAIDHNKDGFLDMPQNNTTALMNRWLYLHSSGYQSQLAVKYVHQNLQSGQTAFDPALAPEIQEAYGIDIDTRRWEGFWKNGFAFDRPLTSMGLILNGVTHSQQSLIGRDLYDGREDYFHADLLGKTYIGNTNHTFKAGASFLYNRFDEEFRDITVDRTEQVPGVFAEYHLNLDENLNILAGWRTDFHNLYGTFHTPRLHLKYTILYGTTVRLSAGKAYRVANVLAENVPLFVSARTLSVEQDLQPEESWSWGATVIQRMPLFNRNSTLTADFYRTAFLQQVVTDRYTSGQDIFIYNLDGNSWSNAAQADWVMEPLRNLNIRLAYRWVDARADFMGEERKLPLVPVHRAMVNAAYDWKDEGWMFDATVHYFGSAPLPNVEGMEGASDLPSEAPDFFQVSAQVSKRFRMIDIYAGVENLTNYTQPDPILGAGDPFGTGFDAAVIYAPIMNRRYYAGLRFTLKNNKIQ